MIKSRVQSNDINYIKPRTSTHSSSHAVHCTATKRNSQVSAFSLLLIFPRLIQWYRWGFSTAAFFKSTTSCFLAARSFGDRSGNTCTGVHLYRWVCFSLPVLVRIWLTEVALASVTFTGLGSELASSPLFPPNLFTAWTRGFPSSSRNSSLTSCSMFPPSSDLSESENQQILASVLVHYSSPYRLLQDIGRKHRRSTHVAGNCWAVGLNPRLHWSLHNTEMILKICMGFTRRPSTW